MRRRTSRISRRFTAVVALVAVAAGTALASSPAARAAGAEGTALRWGPCPTGAPAPQQCATLRVPLDYRRPDGPRETVELTRKKATDPARRLGVLIPVPGGPGETSADAAEDSRYETLSARYDIVGISPRGVGESQPLLCDGANVIRARRTRFTDQEMRAYAEEIRRHDQECERRAGDRRPYFTSANNARDLDVVRAVLGETKLNLMGQSYGTYVTAVYGSLFPARLNRNVLDSSIHPRWMWREAWRQQPIAQRRTADAWMTWVAERNDKYGLGATRKQVHATIEALRGDLEKNPISLDGDIVYDGDELDGSVGGMDEVPEWGNFADTVRGLRAAVAEGSTASRNLKRSLVVQRAALADDDEPEIETSSGIWQTTNCEAAWPRDLDTYFADMRVFGERYPYGWGAAGAAPHECTYGSVRPVEPLVSLRRAGYPAGMVVQEEFDASTPYEGGQEMAKLLKHRLLTVTRDGDHVAYGGNECVTAAVDAYFLNGTLPSPAATCAGRPIGEASPEPED